MPLAVLLASFLLNWRPNSLFVCACVSPCPVADVVDVYDTSALNSFVILSAFSTPDGVETALYP